LTNNIYGQEKIDSLLVFVGEKINVTELPGFHNNGFIYDYAFKAKYKVIQIINGQYGLDTIEFEVYDHNGHPPFAEYTNVLLYLIKGNNGKWYHEKYMYSDVYRTMNGRWAGSYAFADYNHEFNKTTSIKPQKISFTEKVSYDLKGMSKETIEKWFPKPYYKIKDQRAYIKKGNYINELFLLKKNGFLKARGYF